MSDADTTQEVPEEEVKRSRERVQQLREELAQINGNIVSSEQSRNNAVRKARLDREAESLERQLETARRRLETSEGGDSDAPAQSANKDEWEQYAEDNGIDVSGLTKAEIKAEVEKHAGTADLPSPTRDQAKVNTETGEVNPKEVERLTDTSVKAKDKE